MGYRDDFYVKKNIIGWTGDIKGKAFSVYFADCKGDPPQTVRIANVDQIVVQFGHITQQHDCPYNIGREEVYESFSYSIFNVNGTMVEEALGSVGKNKLEMGYSVNDGDYIRLHDSRNAFNSVTAGTIDTLAAVIKGFPNIKKRYTDKNGFDAWKIKHWGK